MRRFVILNIVTKGLGWFGRHQDLGLLGFRLCWKKQWQASQSRGAFAVSGSTWHRSSWSLPIASIQLWDSACLAFHKDLRQVSISYWAGPFLQIHHFHVLLASFSFGQYVHESVRCSSEFVILKAALVLVKGCKRFVKMCLHFKCQCRPAASR